MAASSVNAEQAPKCELVYRLVGTAVQCDVCKGKTVSTSQKMRPWMSCVQCDYDECLACFFKRMTTASSYVTRMKLNHAHDTRLFTNTSLKITLECSVCYKKMSPSHLRHRYCPTCNTMEQMNKWFICCRQCAHESSDVAHPPLAEVMKLAAGDIGGDEHFIVPTAPTLPAPSNESMSTVSDNDDNSDNDVPHGAQLRMK